MKEKILISGILGQDGSLLGETFDSRKYELFGICNHRGSINGGHYTASVKNISNQWVNYDDNNVKIAGKSGVTKSFPDNSIIGGFPARDIKIWRRSMAKLYKNIK